MKPIALPFHPTPGLNMMEYFFASPNVPCITILYMLLLVYIITEVCVRECVQMF